VPASGHCATYGWGRNAVAAIAPGGATFALATPSGRLEVRRWSDGALLGIDNGLQGATAVAFSADGSLVGAATADGVKIWRIADRTLLSMIPALANATALAISSDGSVAVARAGAGFKIARPAGVLTISQPSNVGIGLSPDGTLVGTVETKMTSATFTEYIDSVWRVSDGQSVWSVSRGSFAVQSLAHIVFSPDGTKLAVGGGYPAMLRASDGGYLYLANEPLAFSADGTAFISTYTTAPTYTLSRASDGATVRTFNVTTGGAIAAAAFGSGLAMRVVLNNALSQTLAEDGVNGQTFTRTNVASAVLSPDGSLLAIGHSDGAIVLRNATTLAQLSSRPASWIAFSPDSARAAMVTSPAAAVFTRAALTAPNADPSFSLAAAVLSVAFSSDGTLIGTGNSDHNAVLWSASDGSLARTLWNINGHISPVYGIAFSPDGTVVATSGSDNIIKLWRTADGTDLKTISTSVSEYGPLTFLPDGRLVAVSMSGAKVVVWDTVAGTRLKTFSQGSKPVVSADGATLYLTGSNNGIDRYSLSDYSALGPVPLSVKGPEPLSSFQITPNGSVKTTLDMGGVLRVWCDP
jgi:WD40 repeat protein